MPRAAITIDVDGARHYHAIHGLLPPEGHTDAPLTLGLPRFLDACARLALKATIFVVGKDLEDHAYADIVRGAARAGHEIASHSHAHAYDLSRRSPAEMQADVLRSVDDVARVASPPRGFRAPGYNVSEALLDALELGGFTYDSSLLPSPAYFSVRALAIGLHRLQGRTSSSLVGDPRDFAVPGGVGGARRPYRPRRGAHHRRARSRVEGRSFVEIPITTLPFGVPWLGTTLTLSPLPWGAAQTALAMTSQRQRPVVLELHAIDLCDASDGFDPSLVRLQRDLRVPLEKKLERLEATLRIVAQAAEVCTLEEIAREALTAPGAT